MGYIKLEVFGRETMFCEHLMRYIRHSANSEFENASTVLNDVMHLFLNGFFTAGVQAATGRHIEELAAGPVAPQHEIDNTLFSFLSGLDQHCAGPVPKQHTGRPVLEI